MAVKHLLSFLMEYFYDKMLAVSYGDAVHGFDKVTTHGFWVNFEACEARLAPLERCSIRGRLPRLAVSQASQRRNGGRYRKDRPGVSYGRNVSTLRIIPTGEWPSQPFPCPAWNLSLLYRPRVWPVLSSPKGRWRSVTHLDQIPVRSQLL